MESGLSRPIMNASVETLLELDSPSRRKFLKRTVLGMAALGLTRVAWASEFLFGMNVSARDAGRFLTVRQGRVLESICERLIPSGEAMPDAQELAIAARLDDYLKTLDRPVAIQIAQLLDLFEISPLVWNFKFSRFTSLSAIEQDQVLQSWASSRLDFRRTGFQALKRLSMAAYYGQEAPWKAIGYEGPWV